MYVAKEKCNTLKSQKIQMTSYRFVRNRNAPTCLWDYNVEANTICFNANDVCVFKMAKTKTSPNYEFKRFPMCSYSVKSG